MTSIATPSTLGLTSPSVIIIIVVVRHCEASVSHTVPRYKSIAVAEKLSGEMMEIRMIRNSSKVRDTVTAG